MTDQYSKLEEGALPAGSVQQPAPRNNLMAAATALLTAAALAAAAWGSAAVLLGRAPAPQCAVGDFTVRCVQARGTVAGTALTATGRCCDPANLAVCWQCPSFAVTFTFFDQEFSLSRDAPDVNDPMLFPQALLRANVTTQQQRDGALAAARALAPVGASMPCVFTQTQRDWRAAVEQRTAAPSRTTELSAAAAGAAVLLVLGALWLRDRCCRRASP